MKTLLTTVLHNVSIWPDHWLHLDDLEQTLSNCDKIHTTQKKFSNYNCVYGQRVECCPKHSKKLMPNLVTFLSGVTLANQNWFSFGR